MNKSDDLLEIELIDYNYFKLRIKGTIDYEINGGEVDNFIERIENIKGRDDNYLIVEDEKNPLYVSVYDKQYFIGIPDENNEWGMIEEVSMELLKQLPKEIREKRRTLCVKEKENLKKLLK